MVKIVRKGQITLPIETTHGEVFLKKGKTIHDFIGLLPNLGMTIDEIREQAAKSVARDFT